MYQPSDGTDFPKDKQTDNKATYPNGATGSNADNPMRSYADTLFASSNRKHVARADEVHSRNRANRVRDNPAAC